MIEYEDVVGAVRTAIAEERAAAREERLNDEDAPPSCMLPVEPFEAETCDNEPLRVVGIAHRPNSMMSGGLEFVVIKEGEDGELWPSYVEAVYPRHPPTS